MTDEDSIDILIVGGGSAGAVLAARLSETRALRVVLIERGIDINPSKVPPDVADPFPRAYANAAYFSHETLLVDLRDPAPAPFSQPCVLGGGSSVMGMWAVRGLARDFDRWADAGATGWAYSDVLPYFRKLETDRDCQGPVHGHDGPVPIRRIAEPSWPRFAAALAHAARKRGFVSQDDLNGEQGDGIFAMPISVGENERATTATCYLTDEVRARSNLRILTECEVRKLVIEAGRVTGAVILERGRQERIVRAARVVLSAGAIGSPLLLMRSGIGDPADLVAAGMTPTVALPEVGRNLRNHAFAHLGATLLAGRQSPAVRQYVMGGVRMSSGTGADGVSDLLLAFITRGGMHATGNRVGMIAISLVAPKSVGEVRLHRDGATVDFATLSHADDRAALVAGARMARELLFDRHVGPLVGDRFILPRKLPIRMLNTPGIASHIASAGLAILPLFPKPLRRAALRAAMPGIGFLDGPDEPADFEAAVIEGAAPMFHLTGSCAIGKVVDVRLKVMGLENLYVADASVMPCLPSANTNIPTIMVAEKAADLITASTRDAGTLDGAT